jgi:hypothetical protein
VLACLEPSVTAGVPASPPASAFLPARWPPLLYLGFAHLCLIAAFVLVAVDPRAAGGFFYHPRLVAVVHLVTLGWISASILGALYLVAPLAFRLPLPSRAADFVAFGAYAVGVTGMASHFLLNELVGMVWAAGLVVAALAYVGLRVLPRLGRAPVPLAVRLAVGLAFANVLAAGVLGMLLGVNKTSPFLPGSQLQAVVGHAHLAALGWATLMVVGAGLRLLPMILPAAMPRGRGPLAAVLLLQAGAWGLALSFLFGERLLGLAAALAALGVFAFLGLVAGMLRHRRPAPSELRRPDLSLGHALQALAYLLVAVALGLVLAFAPASGWTLRLAFAYGVAGLVGFLAQIVIGVEGRLLPLYAWLLGFAAGGYGDLPPSLHAAPSRVLQAVGLGLWSLGVPALAAGFALDRPVLLGAAAAGLAVAVAGNAANTALALARLWRRRA